MSILNRLPSRSILALASLVLAGACTSQANIATGGGTTTTTTTTSTTSTRATGGGTTTTTPGTGGGNACTQAGGTCELTGQPCAGTEGLAGSCGAAVGAFCCLPSDPCDDPCPVEMLNQTQCAGDAIQTCTLVGSCSRWVIGAACPSGQGCNSTGTKCIATTSTCATTADCGCTCGCSPSGTCECTGGLPPTCNADADCGPTCGGFACSSHTCVPRVCNPGSDAMCNENAGMSSLAGSCNADGTCACKTGFTRMGDGKCG